MKEFECLLPRGINRQDAESAIPKVIVSLGEIVSKTGDTVVFAPLGLSTIKFILLHVLAEHKATPTMTELRKALLRSPANLTQMVDDLEEAGWIRRVASPSDRRVKRIELTETGRDKVREAEQTLAERMKQFFSGYTDEEVTNLLTLLIRFGNEMLSTLGLEGDFSHSEL